MITRDVTFLIDNHIPFNDMTDEEIDSVIEWKAQRKAEQNVIKAKQEALEYTQAVTRESAAQKAAQSKEAFHVLINKIVDKAVKIEEEINREQTKQ